GIQRCARDSRSARRSPISGSSRMHLTIRHMASSGWVGWSFGAALCLGLSTPIWVYWGEAGASDSPDAGDSPTLIYLEQEDRFASADALPPDGGQKADARRESKDPCAPQEKRIQDRKAWLSRRLQEQAVRGMPNPRTGVPNTTAIYCEQHRDDPQCDVGPPPSSFEPDELSLENQKTPEDRDPYVIVLK